MGFLCSVIQGPHQRLSKRIQKQDITVQRLYGISQKRRRKTLGFKSYFYWGNAEAYTYIEELASNSNKQNKINGNNEGREKKNKNN